MSTSAISPLADVPAERTPNLLFSGGISDEILIQQV
jgi:hypothetical protein